MTQIKTLAVSDIKIEQGFNPRTEMEINELENLSKSIAQHGLLQPVIVAGDMTLIAGHRRLAACQLAGVKEVDAVVRDNGGNRLVTAIVENTQRVELSPLEEALALERLLADGKTQGQVQQLLNWSGKRFKSRREILLLGPVARELVGSEKIPLTAAKHLAAAAKINKASADAIATWLTKLDKTDLDLFAKDPGEFSYGEIKPTAEAPVYDTFTPYSLETVDLSDKSRALADEHSIEQFQIRDSDLQQAHAYGAVAWYSTDRYRPTGLILDHKYASEVAETRIAEYAKQRKALDPVGDGKTWEQREAERKALAKAPIDPETGEKVLDEEKAKEVRKVLREEDLEHQRAAAEHNETIWEAFQSRFTPDKVKLDLQTARLLASMTLGVSTSALAARGMAYVDPSFRTEEERKNGTVKRTYKGRGDGIGTEVGKWVLAGTSAESVLARLLQVLLAAKYADDRVVAQSRRDGFFPSCEAGYGNDATQVGYDEVISVALNAVAKKYLTPAIYNEIQERIAAVR